WMRNQATEGMNHAAMAGEHVTSLGGHPSLTIGKLVESHKHDITQILGEALDHERATLREYYNLLALVVDKSVWLEEYAREQITLEEQHIAEGDKMKRKPGERRPPGRRRGGAPRAARGGEGPVARLVWVRTIATGAGADAEPTRGARWLEPRLRAKISYS